MREYNFRAREFVQALGLQPGESVVLYGMTSANYLTEVLRYVGAEGEVHAVFRQEQDYRYFLQSSEFRGDNRVHPIFAFDGDAHLEPESADVVVALDLFGFFRREDDVYRQAHRALKPGARLVQVRALDRTEKEQRTLHPNMEPGQLHGRLWIQEVNRQRLSVTQHGFRYMEEIPVFETRSVRVFENLADE
jgi:tRNA A58 N-methylase Trm61